jgi:transcriptional regulator with XRE-family HTH domain
MALSDNMKKIRESRGITTIQLAEEVGVTQSLITRFEMGSRIPNVVTALAIAKRLGVTVERLVDGEE